MNETQARDEIWRVGKSLFDRGYVHATAGHISVRLSDGGGGGFLITPTDACLGLLHQPGLARLDANLQQQSHDRDSKTIALHAHIHAPPSQVDPQTSYVLHTHSTHCVPLSLHNASEE